MGYDERHLVTDSKIALGLLAVGLALAAQFYPAPYPENKTVLALCIAGYCALNLALQYITSFVENGVVLFTKPNPGAGKAAVAARGLAVRVTMLRTRGDVRRLSHMRADARRADHPDTVTETLRVCEFIYEDGVVAEDKFRNAVEALVERFERSAGEGDKASDEKRRQQKTL